MTYGLFLIIFLVIPILGLGWALRRVLTRRYSAWIAILMGVALVYTTPWDNYLVATGVWWYDPERVLGIRFGWVPLEEYLFFLLQPILTGMWALALNRWLGETALPETRQPALRWIVVGAGAAVWAIAASILLLSSSRSVTACYREGPRLHLSGSMGCVAGDSALGIQQVYTCNGRLSI